MGGKVRINLILKAFTDPHKNIQMTELCRLIFVCSTGGKPNLEGSVKVHIRGTFEERVFDEREVEFVVGEGYEHNIVDGIEKGVVTMRRNERSKFFISSQYGFEQVCYLSI